MEARMRIFGMGLPELLVILAVILLIFGPKNLPKLGSALGKTVKNLRDGMGGDKEEAETEELVADKPAPKSSSKTEE
jgi:sec-independent protein translocase protein TatA